MDLIQQLKERMHAAGLFEQQLEVSRNEHLKVQGSVDTNLYYVVQGSLRVYVIDEWEEHTIRFGYQGSFITALDSFITEAPSEYYIQAIKKTELRVIDKNAFNQFMKTPEHSKLWHQLWELLVVQQLERERDLLTSSPLERYHRVLQRSPRLFQEIPNKYIASYLRMTPETLSRIKKS